VRYIVLVTFFSLCLYADSFDDIPEYSVVLEKIEAIGNGDVVQDAVYQEKTAEGSLEIMQDSDVLHSYPDAEIIEISETIEVSDDESVGEVKIIKYMYDEQIQKEEISNSAKVDISFWNLLDDALMSSAKIILKKHDVKFTEANVDIVKNEYYPKISLNYDHEYYHGYSRTSTANIGGASYPSSSDYRNSLYINFDYELYRFGATGLKAKLAQSDVEIVKSELSLEKESISKELLYSYTSALKAQEHIIHKMKILSLQNSLFDGSRRLYEVGKIAKTDLIQKKISIINLEKEIVQQRLNKMEALKNIEILTTISLDSEASKLDMLEPKKTKPLAYEQSMRAKNLKLQLKKKLKEIELLRKDHLPALYVSGEYRLYGSDKDSLSRALRELERNNWRFGIKVKWTIFDGSKTDKVVEQAKIEVEKLIEQYRYEKLDFIAKEQKRELLKESIDKILREEGRLIGEYGEQKEMLTRLEAVGKVSSMRIFEVEMERIKIELDFRLKVIDKVYEEIMSELVS